MSGASMEATLELWASSLREVKGSVKNLGQPTCLSRGEQPGWCLTMRAAGVMQWTVRLEARTSAGEGRWCTSIV